MVEAPDGEPPNHLNPGVLSCFGWNFGSQTVSGNTKATQRQLHARKTICLDHSIASLTQVCPSSHPAGPTRLTRSGSVLVSPPIHTTLFIAQVPKQAQTPPSVSTSHQRRPTPSFAAAADVGFWGWPAAAVEDGRMALWDTTR